MQLTMKCGSKAWLCLSHDLQAWWASSNRGDVSSKGSGSPAPYRHGVKGRAGRASGISLWEGCVSLEKDLRELDSALLTELLPWPPVLHHMNLHSTSC